MQTLFPLLSQFIAFHTIDGNTQAKHDCLDWIASEFFKNTTHTIKRDAVEDAPYLYYQHLTSEWLFFAHIDVIPAEADQFELKEEGSKLIGRGTSDMKGPQLPFLIAFQEAIAEGRDPKVSILLTSDEEVAGHTIPTLLNDGTLPPPSIAYTPDNGGSPHVITEHKGALWAKLIAHGKGSHGAWPWHGENPIPLLAKAITLLQKHYPLGTETDWQITVTPTQLQGSDAQNKVPELATCGLDIRYPGNSKTEAEILEEITKLLPDGCTIEKELGGAPLWTDPSHPFIQQFHAIASEIEQEDVKLYREHGASDARFFCQAGVPAFLYGPTRGGNIHAPGEWVDRTCLEELYIIAKRLFAL